MDDLEQRVSALEARLAAAEAKLAELKPSSPRARPPPGIEGAISRVECTFIHRGGRGHFCFHRHRCVYLLKHDGLVVYVGRSIRGYSTRYSDHAEKAHDEVIIADLRISSGVHAETAFQALECALVLHYQPRLNVAPLSSLAHPASLWPTRELFRRIVGRVTQ